VCSTFVNSGRTNSMVMTGTYVVRQVHGDKGMQQLVLQAAPVPRRVSGKGTNKEDTAKDVDVVTFRIRRGVLTVNSRTGHPPVRYERVR
jgi:hypothetical protein